MQSSDCDPLSNCKELIKDPVISIVNEQNEFRNVSLKKENGKQHKSFFVKSLNCNNTFKLDDKVSDNNGIRQEKISLYSLESDTNIEKSVSNIPESFNSNSRDMGIYRLMKFGRDWASRRTDRMVEKNGDCNLSYKNVPDKSKRFLMDIFTTLLDLTWIKLLLFCIITFLSSFLFFAAFWYIIAYNNGDNKKSTKNIDDLTNMCVQHVNTFTAAFLFSIETQHTIGYGRRVINEKCSVAIILLCVQACFGLLVQSLLTGLIFARLSRPKRRGETIIFSKNAVICLKNSLYSLLFRVGDMRNSHFICAKVKTLFLSNNSTDVDDDIPMHQETLRVSNDNSFDNEIFFGWPSTIIHRINSESPFYKISSEDLLNQSFELVVILEGTIQSSGMVVQVRTSYLPSEIIWGHQISPLLTYQKSNGRYVIDYSNFHETIPLTTMPDCSAYDYELCKSVEQPDQRFYSNWTSLSMKKNSIVSDRRNKYSIVKKSSDLLRVFSRLRKKSVRNYSEDEENELNY